MSEKGKGDPMDRMLKDIEGDLQKMAAMEFVDLRSWMIEAIRGLAQGLAQEVRTRKADKERLWKEVGETLKRRDQIFSESLSQRDERIATHMGNNHQALMKLVKGIQKDTMDFCVKKIEAAGIGKTVH